MRFRNNKNRAIYHWIGGPVLWVMIMPLVILDISVTIYHAICFRLWKIPLVPRSKFIRLDRHKLSYLSFLEKIYCTYCGYANGLMWWASVIAGETEGYWCSVKHEKKKGYVDPAHHKYFLDFGDEKTFQRLYNKP